MGTSQIPALIDALFSRATTALAASSVLVTDGYGVTDDPADFLMIGIEEPSIPAAGFAGSSDQVPGPMSTARPRDENGAVWCAAYSWNGDGIQKTARDAAYSYMAAVETILRADPNLGIASGGNFVAQMGDTQRLTQNQDSNGSDALLIFNVIFFARI
jgi:hypothetical protein